VNPHLRLILTWVLAVPVALVLLIAVVRRLAPLFAFFPTPGESVTPRDLGVEYETITVGTDDGERLHGWWLAGPGGRANILYFHGNGGNLSVWAPILTAVARRTYNVLAFDYRGYGLSTGRPTEPGLYRDVEATVERFPRVAQSGLPVIYWGRSLGVVMAAYAAAVRTPDGLILESGFPDARSLVRDSPLLTLLARVSRYRFPAAEFLGRMRRPVPVLVLHGDDDHVVPIGQGRALFDAIAGPKRFVTIRRGDHNDLSPSEPERYWEEVDRFIRSLGSG